MDFLCCCLLNLMAEGANIRVHVCTCYVEGMGVYNKICTSRFCLSKWALGLEPRLPSLAASPFIC